MKRRKREQETESVVFNIDLYSVSRLQSTGGSNGIHLSFWLSLWIWDNSQNSELGLCKIGRTEWSLESKGRMEERYKMRDVQNTFYYVQTKDSKIHLNRKISDAWAREGAGVLIMCERLTVCVCSIYMSLCGHLPRVGHTLHDGFVSPDCYTCVLRGDDDGGGNGVRGSSHIYHTHRNAQKWTKSLNCMPVSD